MEARFRKQQHNKRTSNEPNEKRTMKLTVILFMALLSILGFTLSLTAGDQVQIKGTFAGGDVEVTSVGPTLLLFHGIDNTGRATYLGTFTMEIWLYLDLTQQTAYGQYELTMPNGATLNADFTAVGFPTEEDPNVIHYIETGIITGGTGRFAGATGIITREGLNNEEMAILGGTISTPGANKH
jgi:hypothetical protein